MSAKMPWISMLLAIAFVIGPPGREIIHDALFSGEALSRNLAQFVLWIGLGLFVLIAALEWLIRIIISRRRARGATT